MANECHKERAKGIIHSQAFIGKFPKHEIRKVISLKRISSDLYFCRFFTEDECLGSCKDAKRSHQKKKVVCPHAAPICQLGCVLGKEDNDEGTCLTCICNKKPGE